MSDDHGIITFGLDAAEASMEQVLEYLQGLGSGMMERVARKVLPELGDELASMIHQSGPRSAKHRGPGKKGQQGWRSEYKHAVDTIKRSNVYRDKQTGDLMVMVGPGKGDNSPSFYLKFLEYGVKGIAEHAFIRPARRRVMDQRAAQVTKAAINEELEKGGGK